MQPSEKEPSTPSTPAHALRLDVASIGQAGLAFLLAFLIAFVLKGT